MTMDRRSFMKLTVAAIGLPCAGHRQRMTGMICGVDTAGGNSTTVVTYVDSRDWKPELYRAAFRYPPRQTGLLITAYGWTNRQIARHRFQQDVIRPLQLKLTGYTEQGDIING